MHKINPKLIYCRISGYGNDNKDQIYDQRAGRDLNYLANSGILAKFRRNEKVGSPTFPANILTYYASGSILVFT